MGSPNLPSLLRGEIKTPSINMKLNTFCRIIPNKHVFSINSRRRTIKNLRTWILIRDDPSPKNSTGSKKLNPWLTNQREVRSIRNRLKAHLIPLHSSEKS